MAKGKGRGWHGDSAGHSRAAKMRGKRGGGKKKMVGIYKQPSKKAYSKMVSEARRKMKTENALGKGLGNTSQSKIRAVLRRRGVIMVGGKKV